MALAIGVMLGALVFYKVAIIKRQAFGEIMMFAYYAYLMPLSMRIRRGFYEDGIWPIRPSSDTRTSAASAGARLNTTWRSS